MLHPAILLLAWTAGALLLPLLPMTAELILAAAALVAAFAFARLRVRRLLARARWLLLSLFLLFSFATPGIRVEGVIGVLGVTVDGIVAAAEHVARLVLLLATLALLHEHLGTRGFMSGLYWLLRPVSGGLRDRIVVRLMLVIEFVEAGTPGGWRQWLTAAPAGPNELMLDTAAPRGRDWAAMALLSAGLILVLAW
jgi:hypothetical protein